MPFILVFSGLIMIVVGVQNTHRQFGTQLRKDFTGPGNFFYWVASLGAVGAVGYIPKLRGVSLAFMTLIIVVLVIAAKGLFPKLTAALEQGPVAPDISPELTLGKALRNSLGSAIMGGDIGAAGNLGAAKISPSGISKDENPIGWMLDTFKKR